MNAYKMKLTVMDAPMPFSRTIIMPETNDFADLQDTIEIVFDAYPADDFKFESENGVLIYHIEDYGVDDNTLDKYLSKGMKLIYDCRSYWKLLIEVEDILDCEMMVPQVVDYEWDYMLADGYDDLTNYQKAMMRFTENPKSKYIHDEYGFLVHRDEVEFDLEDVNKQLVKLTDFDDDFDEMMFDDDGKQIETYQQTVITPFLESNIRDLLLHIYEGDLWIWLHHGDRIYSLFTNEFDEIKLLWNASSRHDIVDERYFSGGILNIEQGEAKAYSYAGHREREMNEFDMFAFRQLCLALSVEIDMDEIPDGATLQEGRFVEFEDGEGELKECNLTLDSVKPLPVTGTHKKLAQKPVGEERLELLVEYVPDFRKKAKGNYATYLMIKGKHAQDCEQLVSQNPKTIAKKIERYLCQYLKDNNKPKSIAMEDKNITSYLVEILEALDIPLESTIGLSGYDGLYMEAFNEVNPISEEEQNVYDITQTMKQEDIEPYLDQLPDELIKIITYRMSCNPDFVKYVKEMDGEEPKSFFMN